MQIVINALVQGIMYILAALGFTRARLGSGSSKAGMAKAGKILCIIGLVVAVINWGLGILLIVMN